MFVTIGTLHATRTLRIMPKKIEPYMYLRTRTWFWLIRTLINQPNIDQAIGYIFNNNHQRIIQFSDKARDWQSGRRNPNWQDKSTIEAWLADKITRPQLRHVKETWKNGPLNLPFWQAFYTRGHYDLSPSALPSNHRKPEKIALCELIKLIQKIKLECCDYVRYVIVMGEGDFKEYKHNFSYRIFRLRSSGRNFESVFKLIEDLEECYSTNSETLKRYNIKQDKILQILKKQIISNLKKSFERKNHARLTNIMDSLNTNINQS